MAETSDLKINDLKSRNTAHANLTIQLEHEPSNPDCIEIAVPRRNNFVGPKSFLAENDSGIIDMNDSSLPSHREFAPSGDRSQRTTLMNSESKSLDVSQPNSSPVYKIVNQKLFSGVSMTLATVLISLIVLQGVIMHKVNRLENDLSNNINYTKRLESILLSTNSSSNTDYKLLEEGLAANRNQTITLETVVIPDIQDDLSDNIAKTNNLENIMIPNIQSNISANVAKTNSLETVIISQIEVNLSSNVAKTNNLETVVIPGIQSNISANVAKTTNLETVVIPPIQSSLSTNVAKTNNLDTVVIPGIQSNISAHVAKTTTLENAIKALPKIYFARTSATAWKVYSSYGIYQTIDMSSYGFVNPPIVITALGGGTAHWTTVGASSVYGLTNKSFSIYIRWCDGPNSLTPTDAANNGWQLEYVIFSTDP